MNKTEPIKVFITDDHPGVIYGISAILSKSAGFEFVGSATRGQEMQILLPQYRPHILLLDLKIPGSDFHNNIAWVLEHSPWVKIIAYTAYYSPELVRDLANQGVSGYIPKTSSREEIIKAITSVYDGEKYFALIPHLQNGSNNPDDSSINDDFSKRLSLTKRELEVLVLICQGQSSTVIGKSLFISKHTVEAHRKNIFRKLDVNSSTELVKFAIIHGLV